MLWRLYIAGGVLPGTELFGRYAVTGTAEARGARFLDLSVTSRQRSDFQLCCCLCLCAYVLVQSDGKLVDHPHQHRRTQLTDGLLAVVLFAGMLRFDSRLSRAVASWSS